MLDINKKVYLVQSVGKTSTVTLVDNINIKKSQLVFIGIISELKTIEGASHWVHADKPEEFVKIVNGFLAFQG